MGEVQSETSDASAALAARLAAADVSLYGNISAELTHSDKRCLLHIQRAVRAKPRGYVYLEIGSHLGGSIQPHLMDPACTAIHSIDPRPLVQADARGFRVHYPDNSTERMLENLRRLAPEQLTKVVTYQVNAEDVSNLNPIAGVDLIFIDGEHTDDRALADFKAVLPLCNSGAVIVFHDAPLVHGAIKSAMELMKAKGISFRSLPLPDTLFAVFIDCDERNPSSVFDELSPLAALGYLSALQLTDGYRAFYQMTPFRLLRSVVARLGFQGLASRFGYGQSDTWKAR
jgi:hypothetical protein